MHGPIRLIMPASLFQTPRMKATPTKWPALDWYNVRFLLRFCFSEVIASGSIAFTVFHYDATIPNSLPIVAVVAAAFAWAIWVCGPISGPQITPIIPVSLVIIRHITVIHGVIAIVGEFLGVLLAYWIAWGLASSDHPNVNNSMFGITTVKHITEFQGFWFEFLIAVWVIWAVLATLDEFRAKPFSHGHMSLFFAFFALTMVWVASLMEPYTGCSINPFRSLVPAFFNNYYTHVWIYFAGPFGGSIVGTLIYELILTDGASCGRIKAWFTDPNFDRHLDYTRIKHNESNG